MPSHQMSRDRVHFRWDECVASSSAQVEAFRKAFNQSPPCIDNGGVTVVCRPSQFARFLVYRNELGGRNGFKNLCAKLVPQKDSCTLDVSRNDACV